jgi:hypothetical protein
MRTWMNKPALLLSLLVLSALGLVACEGGDDEDSATEAKVSADTTTEAKVSREQVQELKREANTWAALFAGVTTSQLLHERAMPRACNKYMGQEMCERLTPVSEAFQKSFADATVEDIAIKGLAGIDGDTRLSLAAVKFSNGEVVMFSGARPGPEPPAGSCAGPGGGCTWNIAEVDQNRRFIQAATVAP